MGKKNKKQKKEEEEEHVANEQQELDETENVAQDSVDESPKKKKKKSKNKEAKQELEENQEENGEPAEDEEEEESELVIKSNKKRSHSESENGVSQVDDPKLNKALRELEGISDELIEQFRSSAENLTKKHKNDSIRPLAAALVCLTGAHKVAPISLLTQREGYTTYCITKKDEEIRGKSFGFGIIKRILGEEEGDRAVSHITFSKDHMSLVFDVPSKYDEVIQEKWYDTASLEMAAFAPNDTLPELEEGSSGGGGGNRNGGGRGGPRGGGRGGPRGGGRGGPRGGGRGGFNGGRGGFERNNYSNNKKITFDD